MYNILNPCRGVIYLFFINQQYIAAHIGHSPEAADLGIYEREKSCQIVLIPVNATAMVISLPGKRKYLWM